MSITKQKLYDFVGYARKLKGYEKGEAQLFCERLFKAFGHPGLAEVGARLEQQVKVDGQTRFADLYWKDRLLLEMKKRGENLDKHYRQAFEYWINLVPHRPRYVVLCNFDEFWIYDFDLQIEAPMDKVPLADLPQRITAFNFLFPQPTEPHFRDNLVAVTQGAANHVARVFNHLVDRKENRARAQLFTLQCVFAMFAEDFDLLPPGLFTGLLKECLNGGNTYDLIGGLFHQMNAPQPARGGRFKDVRYFDGGLFQVVDPIELTGEESDWLYHAALEDWSKVQPAIFGTLFEGSMDKEERHAFGAHFTSEADIQKVVLPTIVRPWRERIDKAERLNELVKLRNELAQFQVLDPACGSGNFLYVAFREMKRLEMEILSKIQEKHGTGALRQIGALSLVSERQFHGIDWKAFPVELAKVTLILAKELALLEFNEKFKQYQIPLPDLYEESLPLTNLGDNILHDDALFCDWPEVDAIIGNPPFQSKNKMQQELGREYVNRVRERHPDVPGRADYCVYWFRRAHDELPEGGRAGLVGTNTIRQNYSRQGGLEYIVNNGGAITEAVSSQVWSGEAAVHVSIVNWVKGEAKGGKRLLTQLGDSRTSPWEKVALPEINAALSPRTDVTAAEVLEANKAEKACYQGQTHGNKHFLLSKKERDAILARSPHEAEVIFPYLTANDLFTTNPPGPKRFVIDFQPRDVLESAKYKRTFERIKKCVLPEREKAAREEEKRNFDAQENDKQARINHHHKNFLKNWWLLSYSRPELISRISMIDRYVCCSRVTKRPIFLFVSSTVHPDDLIQVFTFDDDYSHAVLQSSIHWDWFTAKCSTLKRDFRYTSASVFDTFPWPQSPTLKQVRAIARAARGLRAFRTRAMGQMGCTLRELYRSLDVPGKNPLKDHHEALDKAVRDAYGMAPDEDILAHLLALNLELAKREEAGESVVGPGLPPCVKNPSEFITDDCVSLPS